MTNPHDSERGAPEQHGEDDAAAASARDFGLLGGLPVGLYRCTPEGRFLDVNATLVELLGYPDRATLLASPSPGLYVRPSDRRRWLELLDRDGVVRDFETQLRRPDGSLVWVRDSACASRAGREPLTSYLGIVVDVTQGKIADEVLRRSEERFLLAARATKDTLWDWDFATDDIWWNEGITALYGYPPQAAGGMPEWIERVHPQDRERVVASLHTMAESGSHQWNEEYRFRRCDGSYAVVYNRGHVLRDADGSPMRMIGAMMDITERHALEGQLRHAMKMEAVGRLAGGIAHDFNNLLTAILGHTDLVLSGLGADDANRSAVEEVSSAAHRAAALTRQLLAFSRKQTLQPQRLDLNGVVASMDKMLRRLIGEEIVLSTQLADRLGAVRADQGQLEQVIVNLVVNARDAMPRGGTLRLATTNAALGESKRDVAPGPYVRLAVSDDGVGMPPETLARIFEPFFTTKDVGQGTGLGLATVYGIVRQSGGYIEVTSDVGRGTTFDIFLPRLVDDLDQAPPSGDPRPPTGGSETILLVEDEPSVRRLARRVLERLGYAIIEAANGAAALATANERAGTIDLLLTDVVMPEMRGNELAAALAPLRPDMAVLFISGYTDGAVDLTSVRAAGSAFLAKPFTPDALARKVRDLLDARAALR
jgi:PAS domain S-box-containing protein